MTAMFGAVMAAAATMIVTAVVAVMVRRIRRLQRELDQVYEAQHILQRAHDRRDRKHLHLLVTVPLAWIVGKLTSSGARLAAATAVSGAVTGASLLAIDSPTHQVLPPPAGAETTTPVAGQADQVSSVASPVPMSSTDTPTAVPPPGPAEASESGPSVPPSATAPTPPPTTTTTTTVTVAEVAVTTTSTLVELPPIEILPCLNPQGFPLPAEACP